VFELFGKLLPKGLPPELGREMAQVNIESVGLTMFFLAVDAAGLPLPDDSQVLRERLSVHRDVQVRGADLAWLFEWPRLELRSMLALAQHHGLPTRLLDWTHDSRVAAFFAARDSLETGTESLAVYALDRTSAWVHMFGNALEDFAEKKYGSPSLPRIRLSLVTAPAASNPNLRAQRGLFTLVQVTPHEGGDNVSQVGRLSEARRPLDSFEGITLRKVTLPTTQAAPLLKILALEGVTAARVWPNYDGVIKSIRDAAEGRG